MDMADSKPLGAVGCDCMTDEKHDKEERLLA